MIKLYKAFILPHLEYCGSIPIGITESLSDKLEDANYFILRTSLGLPKSPSYDSIHRLINMRTLQHAYIRTSPCNARIAGDMNTFRNKIDKLNLVPFIYR